MIRNITITTIRIARERDGEITAYEHAPGQPPTGIAFGQTMAETWGNLAEVCRVRAAHARHSTDEEMPALRLSQAA